jgi:NADH-quinone oxidoreductase subunit A
MTEFSAVYIYLGLVTLVTCLIVLASALFVPKKEDDIKWMPYESGMRTTTQLFQERFPIHHYLVALIFLVFDIEVVFFYPWAVVAKALGSFAFYEMAFFVVALSIGFAYVWRQGGLQWE